MFQVKLLNDHAVLPKRMSAGSAGYDLSSCENVVIPPGQIVNVCTGISIAVNDGLYARTAGRTSLCKNHQVVVGADVIDSDYRGEVRCFLINHGKKPFEVEVGDRIAQLVLCKIAIPEPILVNELPPSSRGSQCLGSTGKSLQDDNCHN